MAEILKVSRVGGFRFNHLLIDNTIDDNIFVIDVNRPVAYNGNNLIQIEITIGLFDYSQRERRIKQRELLQHIVGKSGKLYFLDEPMLYYDATLNSNVEVSNANFYTELKLVFESSPCMYQDGYDDIEEYTGLPIKLDVTSGNYRVFNFGNAETYPMIQVTGTVQCTIGNYSFSIMGATSDIVYIDPKNMVVYSLTGGKKVSKLNKFTGAFPIIVAGENTVTVSGTGKVKLLFRDAFIV